MSDQVTIKEQCGCGATITVTGGEYRFDRNPVNPRSAEEITERWRTDHHHDAPQGSQDAARSDGNPVGGGADGQGDPSAAPRRLRILDAEQARHNAHHATELGGHAGIAAGLAAIAHALLAQEPR